MVEVEDGAGQAPVSGASTASSAVPQSKGPPSKPPQGPPPTYLAKGKGRGAKGSVIGPVGDGASFVPGTRVASGPILPGAKPRAKSKATPEAGSASTPTSPARPDEAPMEPVGNYENDDGTFSTICE